MNRAILVQRPEPSNYDISQTGAAILGLENARQDRPLMQMLLRISNAFYSEYVNQKGRDFIGMRDYYCLIKFLRPFVVDENEKVDESGSKISLIYWFMVFVEISVGKQHCW